MTLLYEVVNPSDACTIEAPDDAVAGAAILFLGEGRYGCTRADGKVLPTMHLVTDDARLLQALRELEIGAGNTIDARFSSFLKARRAEVADALASLVYCDLQERAALMASFEGLPDRAARLAKYNDTKRTSVNDIGRRAAVLAAAIRREGGGS